MAIPQYSVTDHVKVLYPDLYKDENRQYYIDIATQQTPSMFSGWPEYKYMIALRACHLYYIQNSSISGGGVINIAGATSIHEGELSISYGQSASDAWAKKYPDLWGSRFGQQLIALMEKGSLGVATT